MTKPTNSFLGGLIHFCQMFCFVFSNIAWFFNAYYIQFLLNIRIYKLLQRHIMDVNHSFYISCHYDIRNSYFKGNAKLVIIDKWFFEIVHFSKYKFYFAIYDTSANLSLTLNSFIKKKCNICRYETSLRYRYLAVFKIYRYWYCSIKLNHCQGS